MALITPDYTVITSDVDQGKIAARHPGSPGAEPGFGQGPRCGQTAPGGYRPRASTPWSTAAVRCSGNPRMKPTPCACCGRSPAAPTRCTPASASARAAERGQLPWRRRCVHSSTIVEDDLRAYVRTPEPYDKAGAYAIQGQRCPLVRGASRGATATSWGCRSTARHSFCANLRNICRTAPPKKVGAAWANSKTL